MKNVLVVSVMAALVLFCLVPAAASAEAITVANYSFELPDKVGGYQSGGTIPGWTAIGNYWIEGRSGRAGPTDGFQAVEIGGSKFTSLSQVIGSVADFAAYPRIELTFDARIGQQDGAHSGLADGPFFNAYFTVNGTPSTGDVFTSTFWTDRLLRKYAEIKADTGAAMDTFAVSLNTTSLQATDVLAIEFAYPGPAAGTVMLDNVRLDAIPEPGTLALLGMALLGLGWYAWRKRR